MKISARNKLKGTVVDITEGATTSHVRIDIAGNVVAASITNEAVDELQSKPALVAVEHTILPGWIEFAGDEWTRLPADADAIVT
jgi:molybdopterin-binding protein